MGDTETILSPGNPLPYAHGLKFPPRQEMLREARKESGHPNNTAGSAAGARPFRRGSGGSLRPSMGRKVLGSSARLANAPLFLAFAQRVCLLLVTKMFSPQGCRPSW